MNRALRRKQSKQDRKAAKNKSGPDHISKLLQQGLLALQAGQTKQAKAAYRQVLDFHPEHAKANHMMSVFAYQDGNFTAAMEFILRAIEAEPKQQIYYNNLGIALHKLDRLDEAVANYRQALVLKPDYADALNNLGMALQDMELPEEAIACFQKAIALKPDYTDSLGNLGAALHHLGQLDSAIAYYRQALAINNHYAKAKINLGAALSELGRLDEAVVCLHQALAIDPHDAKAYCNLGRALNDLGRLDEALASFNKALAIDPGNADALNNQGIALQDMGRLDDAVACYRKALAIDPGFAVAHSNLIFIQDLFSNLDQAAQQMERARWDQSFIKPLAGKIKPHANEKNPDRQLRIGYVSADFRRHSACQGFAPLILEHDRKRFEVICYDANPVPDALTQSLRAAASGWRSTLGVSDASLAEMIRKDAIDILVDLSGHTRGARLTVFGHKPAPIQVTGIGHMPPGISTIDYRLTTAIATKPEEEAIIPEKPIYLNTYFGFLPPPHAPPINDPPCLRNATITFGCLNRFSKISSEALTLWARILSDVSGSRLLIKAAQMDDAAIQGKVRNFFANHGISNDRLILLGKSSQRQHLETYNLIDIALDPFPQGGGMTTLESLWMGTPVIGLVESSKIVGRQIAFICQPLGLDQWIVESIIDYHKIAIHWANHRQALAGIRATMRQRIMNVYGRFPQEVENAYLVIWRRWCAGG